ncbi:MAG TPA: alanine racemase [Microlunatus sp.]
MSGIILRVDVPRWRAHLRRTLAETPSLVPVDKGNGYGYGLVRLALEAARLGVDTLAVGMAEEVAVVRDHFTADLVVLTPWRPDDEVATALLGDSNLVTTVSRLEDLAAVGERAERPPVLVEVLTSMRRYGIPHTELPRVPTWLDRVDFRGWTIHLPISGTDRVLEAEQLGRAALAAARGPLWFSHLSAAETREVADRLGTGGAAAPVRLRLGTMLWSGGADTHWPMATVLDVHPVVRGQRVGYRQRRCLADGWIIVMAGGTSQGIGMEAPTAASSLRQRAISVASGSMEAAGWALSPYTIAGKKRWFIEPPHMQSSLIFLPRAVAPPAIGDEVPVRLRLNTAVVDHLVEVEPGTGS